MIKILLLIFCTSTSLFASSDQILKIINEEIVEVNKLVKVTKGKDPDHLLRLAELVLEKTQIIRNQENERYLSISAKNRLNANKNSYFSKSKELINYSNKVCKKIIKYYPRYSRVAEAYYIIGFNLKEESQEKRAVPYFQRAIKLSRNSQTSNRARIALAEIYYNQKNFNRAIPLYEKALRGERNKLWTKDSYNLAWCYYRDKNYKRSIAKFLEVYKQSKNSKYVNMSKEVERDIGQVYALSGQIQDGISFYNKIGINFTDNLVQIATMLQKEGRSTDANMVLSYAERYANTDEDKQNVYIEKLLLSEKYNRFSDHLNYTRKLVALAKLNKLSNENYATTAFQVKKMSALLQKRVVAKTYKRTKAHKDYYIKALEYFDHSSYFHPKEKSLNNFYKGETAYAAKDYAKAISFYNESYTGSKDKSLKKRSVDNMLVTLGLKELSTKLKEQYYIPVYSKFIESSPKDSKTKEIYQKLFKVYLERSQYDECETLIKDFNAKYPSEKKTTEAMIASLMDEYKKQGNVEKIQYWASRIEKKEFIVSENYYKTIQQLLTNLQIAETQDLLKVGKKADALKGYYAVLDNPYSTKKSKTNATYNIAVLYYDKGDFENTYKWAIKSIESIEAKELKNFSKSILAMSKLLFLNLEGLKSAIMSEKLFSKLCYQKDKYKDTAFRNALFLYSAEENIKKAMDLIKLAKKCGADPKVVQIATIEVLNQLYDSEHVQAFEKSVQNLATLNSYKPALIGLYSKLIDYYQQRKNIDKAKKLYDKRQALYLWSLKNKKEVLISDLNVLDSIAIEELRDYYMRIFRSPLSFPEDVFNKQLDYKFQKLNVLFKEINLIVERGAPEAIANAFDLQIDSYKEIIINVNNFQPLGKSKEYINSFKKTMDDVLKPLKNEVRTLKSKARETIIKNGILGPKAVSLLNEEKVMDFNLPGSLLMERAGGYQ